MSKGLTSVSFGHGIYPPDLITQVLAQWEKGHLLEIQPSESEAIVVVCKRAGESSAGPLAVLEFANICLAEVLAAAFSDSVTQTSLAEEDGNGG